jgi:hypothetical protein
MNLKSKLRVTKPLATIISLVSIIILSIVFQRCETEELVFKEDYLDVELEQETLSESDFEILKLAQERMDEFVKVKNGKYTTSLKSGVSINISDELFSHFKMQIEYSNLLIQEKGLVLSGKTFHAAIIDDKQLGHIGIPRLKSGSAESTETGGVDGVKVTQHWYGTTYDISISDNTLRYQTYAAGAASIVLGATGLGAPLAASFGLGALASQILRDEYSNGVVISVCVPNNSAYAIPYSVTGQ